MRSGGADYALRLAQEIRRVGWDVTVLTSNIPGVVTDPCIRVLPLLRTWGWSDFLIILQTLRDLRPDVVNLHFSAWTFNDHPMIGFVPEFIRRWQPQAVIVTHIETHVGFRTGRIGFLSMLLHRILKLWSGKNYSSYEFGTTLRSSHKIAVLSSGNLSVIAKEYPEVVQKSVLTPPPPIMPMVAASEGRACRSTMRQQFGMSEDESLIAFYGYLYPGKGIENLLDAFKQLRIQGHEVRLIFIGDVPDDYALNLSGRPRYRQELKDQVLSMGLEDRVLWTGYIESDSDLASRYLRAADIVCVPFYTGVQLHRSSFSFPAAHGLPIVSTRGQDTEEVFVDGENVILCPPNNESELANAIERLLTNPTLRERLCRGAEQLSKDWFTWEATVSKTFPSCDELQHY